MRNVKEEHLVIFVFSLFQKWCGVSRPTYALYKVFSFFLFRSSFTCMMICNDYYALSFALFFYHTNFFCDTFYPYRRILRYYFARSPKMWLKMERFKITFFLFFPLALACNSLFQLFFMGSYGLYTRFFHFFFLKTLILRTHWAKFHRQVLGK